MIRETLLVDEALGRVAALLPASWRLESRPEHTVGHAGADAVMSLVGPDGANVSFLVEAKRSGTPTGLLMSRLREQSLAADLPLLFVSDYIGPKLREALATEGISYADATGWVRVASDVPLILLTGRGDAKSPRARTSATVARLNGVAVSRVIRALCAERPPFGVRKLAAVARVSPGSVSKILPTLAAESAIDRDERGGVVAVRRRALIQRWIQDYSFVESNESVGYFIAPRGLDSALNRLDGLKAAATLTGAAAARRLLPQGVTPVVPMRLLAAYTATPSALVDALRLIPADSATANTVIGVPQDGRVLIDDIAPTALVLADLLTLPGRGNAEAEQLMDALSRTDPAWEA